MSVAANGARRLLLGDAVDRDAVDRAAVAHRWSLVNVYSRREDRPRRVVFATPDGALVTLVEDHRVAARYLVIIGHDPDAPLAEARRSLAHRTLDDVRAAIEHDRVRALCWLGVIGPASATGEWLEAVRAGLADGDERVRAAARFAAEGLGWPELSDG